MFGSPEEILLAILVFLAVFSLGASFAAYRANQKKQIEDRMKQLIPAELLDEKPKERKGIMAFFERVGNLASHGRASTQLWEQMIQAGFLHPLAPTLYTGVKIVFFVIGFLGGTLAVLPISEMMLSTKMTVVFLSASVLFFAPNLYVVYRMRKRHDEIYRNLPEAIDLLEICVSSGLGLDMAWNVVADEIRQVSPVLASSMSLTNFEMHLGVSRIEAMKHMADRTGVDELKSLAAILIQTDRFGTSIADTLKIFAQSIREERSFVVQEAAEKMSVKMVIPMILFIFPAALITMVGPAVIALSKSLKP